MAIIKNSNGKAFCSDCGKYLPQNDTFCTTCFQEGVNKTDLIEDKIKAYYKGLGLGVEVTEKDKINPSHYKQGNIEVCDFILDQKMNYLEGNCCKYLCRYKHKNGVEDLKKAKWYLNKLIETLGTKI